LYFDGLLLLPIWRIKLDDDDDDDMNQKLLKSVEYSLTYSKQKG